MNPYSGPPMMPLEPLQGKPLISVIIPALNEAENLARTFSIARANALVAAAAPPPIQYIVADGGSTDSTPELARSLGLEVALAPPGRGRQMNAGAALARADYLLFLHADTWLPPGWPGLVLRTLARPGTIAGAFRFGLHNPPRLLKIIEAATAFRCRIFHLPYGDQAIFMTRQAFETNHGWPEMFMEDLEFISRLKKQGRVRLAPAKALTSPRRWQAAGLFRLTAIHQMMVLGHLLNINNATLHRLYRKWNRRG